MEYLGFIFSLTLVLPFVSPLKLGEENDHVTRREGQNLTLACSLTKDNYDVWNNPVVWIKVVNDQKIQMNNMGVLQSPFVDTGRYSLKVEQITGGVNMDLIIDDVMLVDNGTYRCQMDGEDSPPAIEYTVIVPVAVDELVVTTDTSLVSGSKTMYEFDALKPSYLSCQSTGGNPLPELKMFRGEEVITSEFELKVSEERTGPAGLETVVHKMELTNPAFRASADQTGEKLKCVAKLHRLPDLKKTVTGTMDVKYAPQFDCQSYRFLKLPIDIENYVIDCVIKGNPPVAAHDVFWTFSGANATANLTIGQAHESYSTNSSMTEDNHLYVALSITGVNETHFKTYHLQAANSMQQEHFEIYFGEATTTTSTTTTTTTQKPVIVEKPTPVEGGQEGPETGSKKDAGNRQHAVWYALFIPFALALFLGSGDGIMQR